MKPTPGDWPRISPALYYLKAGEMIDWLCRAFGFTVRIRVEGEGGRIEHSELDYGEGLVMVAEQDSGAARALGVDARSPLALAGANTQSLLVYVDDVDAHCAQARAMGARIVDEPRVHDYGAEYWADRTYAALDPEGHLWWFTQRLRDPP